VPGQPFYLRELVYWRVKSLMIQHGVRYNDFGVVFRANRFFNKSSAEPKDIAPNNSNTVAMVLWLTLCSTVGMSFYILIDQWCSFALVGRIIRKYISSDSVAAKY
jgi:hypothetical protein